MKHWMLIWSAWRRRPAEATLTLLAVIFAFALFGVMIALNETARAVIESARLDRLYVNSRFDSPDGLPLALKTQIEAIDGVTGVGAFRWVSGYYRSPRQPAGVWTADEGMRIAWSESPLSSSQWDQLFSTPTGVFVTRAAAERLGLHKGDVFPLTTKSELRADGAPSWTFHVLDVVPDDPEWAQGVIIGNYRYAENARPAQSRGRGVAFRVAVRDTTRTAAIAAQIDQMFANSGTPTISIPSKTNAANRARTGIDMTSMTWGVGSAGLLMIVFLTGTSIAQSVRRRIPEFATLKAIGFTDARVTGLVLLEAAVPCCLGAALGTALAAGLTAIPRRYIPQGLSGVPQPPVSFATLGWAMAFALLIACIGAVLPMLQLKRMNVAAAIDGRSR